MTISYKSMSKVVVLTFTVVLITPSNLLYRIQTSSSARTVLSFSIDFPSHANSLIMRRTLIDCVVACTRRSDCSAVSAQ